jgi:hypothetical protein
MVHLKIITAAAGFLGVLLGTVWVFEDDINRFLVAYYVWLGSMLALFVVGFEDTLPRIREERTWICEVLASAVPTNWSENRVVGK